MSIKSMNEIHGFKEMVCVEDLYQSQYITQRCIREEEIFLSPSTLRIKLT